MKVKNNSKFLRAKYFSNNEGFLQFYYNSIFNKTTHKYNISSFDNYQIHLPQCTIINSVKPIDCQSLPSYIVVLFIGVVNTHMISV